MTIDCESTKLIIFFDLNAQLGIKKFSRPSQESRKSLLNLNTVKRYNRPVSQITLFLKDTTFTLFFRIINAHFSQTDYS